MEVGTEMEIFITLTLTVVSNVFILDETYQLMFIGRVYNTPILFVLMHDYFWYSLVEKEFL